jgi:NADH-quinone oxidoreductase subunit L
MANFAGLVTLIILIPFMGAILNLFLYRNMTERAIGGLGTGAAMFSFVCAATLLAAQTMFNYEGVVVNPPLLDSWIYIPGAGINIPWQFRVDTLSITMMCIITGIGSLIHIYAMGYMHGDSRFGRFFVYLNMFLGFMLILVAGNNYLVTFVGWEGVGLCSFLLIGFWFDKQHGEGWRNGNAARKAFIVNRVGDFGFLMAIFLTFATFGTLDYYKPGEIAPGLHHAAADHSAEGDHSAPAGDSHSAPAGDSHSAPAADSHSAPAGDGHSGDSHGGEHASSGQKGVFVQAQAWLDAGGHMATFGPFTVPLETMLTLITLFMLIGVTGKSAQIPLFVWLPDAMAGPTPVSALIHAATMVTAGIFLVTRSSVFFNAAPLSQFLVTLVGSLTAVMAGFVALGQWDIKKVLAYSTVSQLGFMVAAVGLGGYAAGMFHLITHAFFKALLFLGSGSVIHAVEHGHHHAHADSHGGHDDHGGGHDAHADHGPKFDPQDMRNMGGLWKRMPITFWTYLIGTLALAGIIPFSGFWSKDEILVKALTVGFEKGRIEGYIALALLLLAAGFTAFYMWRQIRLVFLGKPRTEAAAQAPENSLFMTLPLMVLAFLALFGGFLNIPLGLNPSLLLGITFLGAGGVLVYFAMQARGSKSLPVLAVGAGLSVVIGLLCLLGVLVLPLEVLTLWLEHSVSYVTGGTFNLPLAVIATSIALGAMFAANRVYAPEALAEGNQDKLEINPGTRLAFMRANGKLYWDEFYFRFIENPFNKASQWLANVLDWKFWHDHVHNRLIRDNFKRSAEYLANPIDRGAIDAGFMQLGKVVQRLSGRLRGVQTGYVRTYVFSILLGAVMVILIILLPVLRNLIGR